MNKASPWWLGGLISVLVLAALTLLPLAALLREAGVLNWSTLASDTYTQRVVQFSYYQAFLSTVLSLGLAIPVALALAHTRHFFGRNFITTVFSLSLVIPTIVAIYGIVAVYGRTGWLSQLINAAGLETYNFYGLGGILVAHVFFNMPLAVRVLLLSLESIPDSNWRLARQLGMKPLHLWKLIEWPAIRGQLPALALLIFTLCFTSFAIVMTLGGGPRATTIEVAIYQAIRFDYDIPQALTLACIQLSICLLLTLLSTFFKTDNDPGFQAMGSVSDGRAHKHSVLSTHTELWAKRYLRYVNAIIIFAASAFVIAPLAALLVSGFNSSAISLLTDSKTFNAILNTCVAALSAACIAIALAIGLLTSARHLRIQLRHERSGQWLQLAGNVILILPPVVLGTGLFLLLRPYADVFSIALLLVILINSLMALPFVIRILDAPLIKAARQDDKLVRSLGIHGMARLRYIDWPQLRQPLGFAFAIAATLSAGDLSAIALFGSEQVTTLPLLLYQRMNSYQLSEAAVTAAILLLLCLGLFMILQQVISGDAHAKTG